MEGVGGERAGDGAGAVGYAKGCGLGLWEGWSVLEGCPLVGRVGRMYLERAGVSLAEEGMCLTCLSRAVLCHYPCI